MWCFLISVLCSSLNLETHAKEQRAPLNNGAAVWFVSWQHAGHIKALCPIASELQRRGREVRVVVHEEVRHLVPKNLVTLSAGPLPWSWEEELQFRHVLWDPSTEGSQEDGARKADLSERYFNGSQYSLLKGLNESLHLFPEDQWPGLLAIDVSSVGAMDLAEKLSLRFAVISAWPVGPTLQSIGEPSGPSWLPSELFAFTQSAHQQSFPDRFKRFIFSHALPQFMSWAGFHEPRRRIRRALELAPLELLEAPSTISNGGRPLLCILSHWGLDRSRPLPPRAVLVGPVDDYAAVVREAPELPRHVEDWLDSGRVVYVSFGTNVKPKQQVFRAILGAAEALGEEVKFLWDADEQDVQALLNGPDAHVMAFPGNVRFARVPQIRVLSRPVAAFITHCGLNSVHEALHFGVPMLGLPFLGDQLVTARLIVEIGAGLRLSVPSIEAQRVEEALKNLLGTSSFAHAAAHAGSIGSLAGGAFLAANSLEIAMGGVHHLQMIVEHQPVAARLWDVQLALLLVLVVTLLLGYMCCCATFVMDAASTAPSASNSLSDKAGVPKSNRKKRS